MSTSSPRNTTFQPVYQAVSDTFLQIRARPLVYLLIWLTLSLLPYLVLGLVFSNPVSRLFNEFIESVQALELPGELAGDLPGGGPAGDLPGGPAGGNAGNEGLAGGGIPANMAAASLKMLGIYTLIQCVLMLVAVYLGDVLAVSIRQFRERTFPRFTEVLVRAVPDYVPFLKVVLRVIVPVLLKPLGVLVGGIVLGMALNLPLLSSLGFFAGFFLFISGLYRYGLAPFIHLSLNLGGADSCGVSRQFYLENRNVIAGLFLAFFILPLLAVILLLSLFLNAGIYFGAGGMVLWFVQSLFQFIIVMSLVNFAMNSFVRRVDEDASI